MKNTKKNIFEEIINKNENIKNISTNEIDEMMNRIIKKNNYSKRK